jgi:hypothetical protein
MGKSEARSGFNYTTRAYRHCRCKGWLLADSSAAAGDSVLWR